MRGLLIGIFFSVQGTFSLFAVLLQYIFTWDNVNSYPFLEKMEKSCAFWYYVIFVGLSLAGLVLFLVVAVKYKRRQRDDVFNEVNMIEEYFTSGIVTSNQWYV